MSESLDDFIKSNRDELDKVEQPDIEAFWADFQEHKKENRRQIPRWSFVAIAASLLLLIGTFLFYPRTQLEGTMALEELEINDPLLAEYKAVLVSTLVSQDSLIKSLEIAEEEHEDIFEQLKQLDEVVARYRADLQEYGPNKKIVKNLLLCAKQRIQLYEILLHEIELKNNYNELDEKQNI